MYNYLIIKKYCFYYLSPKKVLLLNITRDNISSKDVDSIGDTPVIITDDVLSKGEDASSGATGGGHSNSAADEMYNT